MDDRAHRSGDKKISIVDFLELHGFLAVGDLFCATENMAIQCQYKSNKKFTLHVYKEGHDGPGFSLSTVTDHAAEFLEWGCWSVDNPAVKYRIRAFWSVIDPITAKDEKLGRFIDIASSSHEVNDSCKYCEEVGIVQVEDPKAKDYIITLGGGPLM